MGSVPPGGRRAQPAHRGAAAPRWRQQNVQHQSAPRASTAQQGPPEPPALPPPTPAPAPIPAPPALPRPAPTPFPTLFFFCTPSPPCTHFTPLDTFPSPGPFSISYSKFLQCKPIFHTVPTLLPTLTPLPPTISHTIPMLFPDPRPVPVLFSYPIPHPFPTLRPIFVRPAVLPDTSAGARCPSSRCSAPAAWPARPQWKWSCAAAKVWGSPRSRRDGGSASTAAGEGISRAGTQGTPRFSPRCSPVWPLLARVSSGLSGCS